jgi:hypothetical protein
MDALRDNLNSRSAQTVANLKLIEVSNIPIWKMLSTSSATNTEMIEKYKNYIAVDVAYVYVERVLDIAKQINRSGQVQPAAADAKEALGKLTAQLTDISTRLHNKRVEETSAIMKAAELERQLQFQHQAMIAGIPAQAFTSMQVFN